MLTQDDRRRLRQSFFTRREVDAFDFAYNPQTGLPQPYIDLDLPVWQAVMRRRKNIAYRRATQYYDDTGAKLTRFRLERMIDSQGVDPWEWVKLEYKHGKKKIADFSATMKERRKQALVATLAVRRKKPWR